MSLNATPLSINPTQLWEGNDGPWSTFFIGVGRPIQYLHVLISLTITQPWLVVPEGCTSSDSSTCPSHRGKLFQRNASTTWQDQGLYNLGYEENLGIFENGVFGFDALSTGLPGTSNVTLEKQILAGIATKSFYLGIWGLSPRPTNFSSFDNTYPSMMTNLKEKNLVPSISYGYTAGARYRKQLFINQVVWEVVTFSELKQVPGSLTLGGFDASRFAKHNATFTFAEDDKRDLVVGLRQITISDGNDSTSSLINLLPQPILTFIDAGVPHIWLPASACDLISQAFGLQYDSVTELYLVNETAHKLSQNVTLAFNIAGDISSTSADIVTIEFPYAAFELELTTDYPGINTSTRYFPIRRAANESQYTLGRTFLQQAYIVADYERSNFSVYPCVFSEGAEPDLRSITSPSNVGSTSTRTDSPRQTAEYRGSFVPGVIAAIAVGSIVGVFLISCGAFLVGRRGRTDWYNLKSKIFKQCRAYSRKQTVSKKRDDHEDKYTEMEGDQLHRNELNGDMRFPTELIAGPRRPEELSADAGRPSELEDPRLAEPERQQDTVRHELDVGSIYSYGQTPVSKERVAEDELNANENSEGSPDVKS